MPQSLTPEEVAAARERKAAIARANGSRSRGPKTEAGKNVSRLNRLTHGRRTQCIDQSLCLNIVLLEGEDRTLYVRLYEERCAAIGPRNQVEKDLCARITSLHWLTNRLQATATAALEDSMQSVPAVDLPGVPAAARGQFHFFRAYHALAVQSAALLRSLRADIAAHERSLRAAYAELAQLRKLGPVSTRPLLVDPEREVAQAVYSTGAGPEPEDGTPVDEEKSGPTVPKPTEGQAPIEPAIEPTIKPSPLAVPNDPRHL